MMETFRIPAHNVVKTTSSFLFAFTLTVAAFVVGLIAYTFLSHMFPSVYSRRTMHVEGEPKSRLFSWPVTMWETSAEDVKEKNGLDAHCFVRFLHMITRIFFPVWILSWIILFPVDAAFAPGVKGNTGLDRFTFANIVLPAEKKRFTAHMILEIVVTIWILWNIHYELVKFKPLRRQYLSDTQRQNKAQANTIMITAISPEYASETALRELYAHLPGGLRGIWIDRDLKDLSKLERMRYHVIKVLEKAGTDLARTAARLRLEHLRKQSKESPQTPYLASSGAISRRISPTGVSFDSEKDSLLIDRFVPYQQRPKHRRPLNFRYFSIPFIGERVDSIDWACSELIHTTKRLEEARSSIDTSPAPESIGDKMYPFLKSAFITFNTPEDAHLALEVKSFTMNSQYVAAPPDDILYNNLSFRRHEQDLREILGILATLLLAVVWIFPSAGIGAISNVQQLSTTIRWLRWVNKLPRAVIGLGEGVLPPVLLTLLMMLLPFFLRIISRISGASKKTDIELRLMDHFFIFQVLYSFLVVSLSSGIVSVVASVLHNPESLPVILANNLPKASTFFLTYVLLSGFTGLATCLLQPISLLKHCHYLHIHPSTPRMVSDTTYGPLTVKMGTLFPTVTLIVVIALGYAIISPVINGLVCPIFFMSYQLYKSKFIRVYEQAKEEETGGLFFLKSMQHIFAGLYLQQICLAALLFLAGAIAEGIVTVVLIGFTALNHRRLNRKFESLSLYKPLALSGPPSASPNTDDKPKADHSYSNPVATSLQPTLWLPNDTLGIGTILKEDWRSKGIDVITDGAEMNEMGRVKVALPIKSDVLRFDVV